MSHVGRHFQRRGAALDRLDRQSAHQPQQRKGIEHFRVGQRRGEGIGRIASQKDRQRQLFALGSRRFAEPRPISRPVVDDRQPRGSRPTASGRASDGAGPWASLVTTWAAVIERWDSASQACRTASVPRSMSRPSRTICWHAALRTVLLRKRSLTGCSGASFRRVSQPCAPPCRTRASVRSASSSSEPMPRARAARSSVASRLATIGRLQPRTRSKSSAGPPVLAARRAISASSPCGSTSAPIRDSNPSSANASKKSASAR